MTKNRKTLSSARQVSAALRRFASAKRAKVSIWFFKTGPGEYGEGDKFLGISVPDTRRVVGEALGLAEPEIVKLLKSPWHEERLAGLLITVGHYKCAATDGEREKVFRFYLKHLRHVNNWDLVDATASSLVGAHLLTKKARRTQLYRWARSKIMWQRRIAIVATGAFIRAGQYADTLKLAKLYLADTHDLMHKATGWMLREVGKKDRKVLEDFLRRHAAVMPRTMLRYAIERFPETRRRYYLDMV